MNTVPDIDSPLHDGDLVYCPEVGCGVYVLEELHPFDKYETLMSYRVDGVLLNSFREYATTIFPATKANKEAIENFFQIELEEAPEQWKKEK